MAAVELVVIMSRRALGHAGAFPQSYFYTELPSILQNISNQRGIIQSLVLKKRFAGALPFNISVEECNALRIVNWF